MEPSHTTNLAHISHQHEYNEYMNTSTTSYTILIVIAGFLLITLLALTIFLLIMIYCYSKQGNSYKTASNDLSSFTYSSNLSTSSHSSLITNNTDSLSNTSQSTNSNSVIISKPSLKEISISLPIAKPNFNESKPQLSAESKMKAKTIFESKSLYTKRRGSNNSLTLSINPMKKKLSISNPSKDSLDYLSKASRLLTIPELISISKSGNNFYNEFYLIPFNHAELFVQGSSIKNRYRTIVPNELTRVRLPVRNSDPLSSYINANYISGYKDEPKAYIASQGPMSNTINDFWFTIWNENVSCVVMITKLYERNKNKCELYIPDQINKTEYYDSVKVTVNQVKAFEDYEIRMLTVSCNDETRTLYHYWYTAWPDHNLPDNPDALIQFIKQVENMKKIDETKNSPILVHCSAGVGRTGCFLAIAIGIKYIDNESLIDIVRIVCKLRRERGGMIQTLEQYEFIYQVLAYYCVYYKNFPLLSTSSECSPALSSPSSLCLKTINEKTFFEFTAQTN